jgi:hypothetical protein
MGKRGDQLIRVFDEPVDLIVEGLRADDRLMRAAIACCWTVLSFVGRQMPLGRILHPPISSKHAQKIERLRSVIQKPRLKSTGSLDGPAKVATSSFPYSHNVPYTNLIVSPRQSQLWLSI